LVLHVKGQFGLVHQSSPPVQSSDYRRPVLKVVHGTVLSVVSWQWLMGGISVLPTEKITV